MSLKKGILICLIEKNNYFFAVEDINTDEYKINQKYQTGIITHIITYKQLRQIKSKKISTQKNNYFYPLLTSHSNKAGCVVTFSTFAKGLYKDKKVWTYNVHNTGDFSVGQMLKNNSYEKEKVCKIITL